MKKVLSVLLAGAMVAGMSVSAFATSNIQATVYNEDGECIVGNDKDIFNKANVSFTTKVNNSVAIDGVVPGITMYIPLGEEMKSLVTDGTSGMKKDEAEKKAFEDIKGFYEAANPSGSGATKDWDNAIMKSDAVPDSFAKLSGEDQSGDPDLSKKYFKLTSSKPSSVTDYDSLKAFYDDKVKAYEKTTDGNYKISWNSLTDKDYFKFDVDKDEGSKYVKKIELVYDKKLKELNQRTAFLKVMLNDSQTTDDLKSTGTITFKAKKSNIDAKVDTEKWADDETVKIDYTFWINNLGRKNDDNIGTGDRVFFDPDKNEDNTLVWGDDRAALFFEGNDDGGKFYARLQTKSDSEIYSAYGDPVNADLWFFDFVGNPTVPATSRATLTLGIPWDEDDDYTPKPEDCFIYEKDADGNLIDVTSKFTYDEDNDGTTEIPGWTIKTRTLGTYIISDTELDTTIVDEVEETEEPVTEAPAASTGKEIPNTGSSDMVGAAVVAAVVSLAAAGAVAFKKASK